MTQPCSPQPSGRASWLRGFAGGEINERILRALSPQDALAIGASAPPAVG